MTVEKRGVGRSSSTGGIDMTDTSPRRLLEPSGRMPPVATRDQEFLYSIAVSLKRIADIFEVITEDERRAADRNNSQFGVGA